MTLDQISEISVPSAVMRARGAETRAGYMGAVRPILANAEGRTIGRPAIQGQATAFETLFSKNNGRLTWLAVGCLDESIRDGAVKRLLLDHDDALEVGSTATGLELVATSEGLVFRMPLERDATGAMLSAMTRNGQRADVSVHLEYRDAQLVEVDGREVEVVYAADLVEISLCQEGRVPNMFAKVVDLDDEPASLKDAFQSTSFAIDKGMARIKAAIHSSTRKLEHVKQKLEILKSSPPTARRAYTINDANRWQTERVEQLQSDLRGDHT